MAKSWERRGAAFMGAVLTFALFLCNCSLYSEATRPPKPNLLFFMGESLRPDDLDVYAGPSDAAPNLNKYFARQGSIIVQQMHAAYPLCNPGRTSILVGRSPDVTGVKSQFLDWQDNINASKWLSLPRFLRNQGWYTTSGGKVFHRGTNDIAGWSRIYDAQDDINESECLDDSRSIDVPLGNGEKMPSVVGCRTTATDLPDLIIAKNAVNEIASIAKSPQSKQPFAMFVGLHLPHYPIRLANRFQYNRTSVRALIPPREPPRISSQYTNGLSFTTPKPEGPSTNNAIRDADPFRSQVPKYVQSGNVFSGSEAPAVFRESFRWLHLSGVQQMDFAAGMILDSLEANGFTDTTITVLVSDHAVALGETRVWEKDMPLDIATRVPLLINLPWINSGPVRIPASFIMDGLDMYRTIAGFLNISHLVDATVDGRDMSEFFYDFATATSENLPLPQIPSFSGFSQVVRCSNLQKCKWDLRGMDLLGYTIRTQSYRYTVYLRGVKGIVTDWSYSNMVSEELYDHTTDDRTILHPTRATFVGHEFVNLANSNRSLARTMFDFIVNRFTNGDYGTGLLLESTATPSSDTPTRSPQLSTPTKSPSTRITPIPTSFPSSLSSSTPNPSPQPLSTLSPSKQTDVPSTILFETDSPSSPTLPIVNGSIPGIPPTLTPSRHDNASGATNGGAVPPSPSSDKVSSTGLTGLAVLLVAFIGLLVVVIIVLRQRRSRNPVDKVGKDQFEGPQKAEATEGESPRRSDESGSGSPSSSMRQNLFVGGGDFLSLEDERSMSLDQTFASARSVPLISSPTAPPSTTQTLIGASVDVEAGLELSFTDVNNQTGSASTNDKGCSDEALALA